jgi:hypothetical protein
MHQFPRRSAGVFYQQRRWLSLANLVFALGSRRLYFTVPDSKCDTDGHLICYARSRALGLDNQLQFDHPTIEQVQALGLLTLYLSSTIQL